MSARRRIPVLLATAALASCGGEEPQADPGGPYPPARADERLLADRYRDFAGALERGDAAGICRGLAPGLARSYDCGGGGAPELPQQLRDVEVADEEVFATTDPAVPDEIQISARTMRATAR